jgi:hypothetical protein
MHCVLMVGHYTMCCFSRIILLFSDPYEVIRLFPELLPQQSRGHQEPEQHPRLQDRDLESGLLALIEFLTEVLKHLPCLYYVHNDFYTLICVSDHVLISASNVPRMGSML